MKESRGKKLKGLIKKAIQRAPRRTMERMRPVLSRLTRPLTTTALDPYWASRSAYRTS